MAEPKERVGTPKPKVAFRHNNFGSDPAKMSFGSQGPYYQNLNSGGGGFVQGNNSPAGFGSQATPGGGERKATNTNLRPLNIAQVYLAEQASGSEEYTLDGHPVTHITIVAQVLNIATQTTADVYKLDDGSGEIEARHWVEARSSDDMDADIEDSLGYVRIVGSIRTYQGKRHINATIVRPITDNMEPFFHFNEVMATTMYYKNGPPGGAGIPAGKYLAGNTSTRAVAEEYSNLGPVEGAILAYFRSNPSGPDGHHVKHIMEGVLRTSPHILGGDRNTQSQLFATAMDNLSENGALYSTLDEQHYALCQ